MHLPTLIESLAAFLGQEPENFGLARLCRIVPYDFFYFQITFVYANIPCFWVSCRLDVDVQGKLRVLHSGRQVRDWCQEVGRGRKGPSTYVLVSRAILG